MAFEKYLAPGEKVLTSFRISFRWLVITYIFTTLAFGFPLYWSWIVLQSEFFSIVLLSMMALVDFFIFLFFYSVYYFVTNKKVYKKVGLIGTKVESVDIADITDFVVEQGIIERLLYGMGTIKINTPGSTGFEIIMTRVADPLLKKKMVYELFQKYRRSQ